MPPDAPPSDLRPSQSVLEYGRPDDGVDGPMLPFGVRLGFFLVSLVAVTSAFLPFTFHTAPLDVWIDFAEHPARWDGDLLVIATPFFVAVPLAAWHLRRLVGPRTRVSERVAMYVVGVSCAMLTVAFVANGLMGGNISKEEYGKLMPAAGALLAGMTLVVWLGLTAHLHEAAMAALAMGYGVNAVLLLVNMYSPDHPGWWATLVAVAGMGVEAVLTTAAAARSRRV